MRLMWWMNPAYWSVQGSVFQQAISNPMSDVGKFFSRGANSSAQCWGHNPNGTQGSWGSEGAFKGVMSSLASFCSKSYADYMVDALSNTWTANLGFDAYTIDISANYFPDWMGLKTMCHDGMMQCTAGDGRAGWANIMQRVRAAQPHVVQSGEVYETWQDLMIADANIGGQGRDTFHVVTKHAVFTGDVAGVEAEARITGADAAVVLCHLHPHYDGKQPGGCPSMYFRDNTPTIRNPLLHRMWVSLEAAAGIVSQHDFDPESYCFAGEEITSTTYNGCYQCANPGAWYNVTNDPISEAPSLLSAFFEHRVLNRVALRTNLNLTITRHGHTNASRGGGAIAYLKHDSMGPNGDAAILIFNPGAAANVTIDLSMLPPALLEQGIFPYDLLTKLRASRPLAKSYTVSMDAQGMAFLSGFSLGVFAPRKGKRKNCRADDRYSRVAQTRALQGCVLECASDMHCENIFVEAADMSNATLLSAAPPVTCTLLGSIRDPDTRCEGGSGTLLRRLPGARSGAEKWKP